LCGPEVDAAGQGGTVFDALAAEPVDDIEAADAVMAEDDEELVVSQGIEMLEAGGDGVHRDELGVSDAGDGVLIGLTDIEEDGFAGGEFLLSCEGGDFEGWGHGGFRVGGA
jgi:hypothetical protein